MESKTPGELLRGLRRLRGYSRREFANLVGWGEDTQRLLEYGAVVFSKDHLDALVQAGFLATEQDDAYRQFVQSMQDQSGIAKSRRPPQPAPDSAAHGIHGEMALSGLPFVDRQQELAAFLEMLSHPAGAHQILLLSGEGGMGKTSLLKAYERICSECGIPHATCTLRAVTGDPLEVMLELARDIGWDQFQGLEHELGNAVELSWTERDLLENPSVQFALAGLDINQRLLRLSTITSSFFDDIRLVAQREGSVVCLLDDTEKAGPVTAEWLATSFVKNVNETPGVVAVFAGRQAPHLGPECEDACVRLTLGSLGLDAWEHYAELISASLPSVMLGALHDYYGGRPLEMTMSLDCLAGSGGTP